MELRDYFAGQALAGMLANRDAVIEKDKLVEHMFDAYQIADAMLAARGARISGTAKG